MMLQVNQMMTIGLKQAPTRSVPKGCREKRMMTMAQEMPTTAPAGLMGFQFDLLQI